MRNTFNLHEVNGSSAEERTHTNRTGLHGSGGSSTGRRGTGSGSGVSSSGSISTDGGGGSRLAGSEGGLGNAAGSLEDRLALSSSAVGDGLVGGVKDLVDDVDNTVGDEDVGDDNAGVVHVDASGADGDNEGLAVDGGQVSAVGQTG